MTAVFLSLASDRQNLIANEQLYQVSMRALVCTYLGVCAWVAGAAQGCSGVTVMREWHLRLEITLCWGADSSLSLSDAEDGAGSATPCSGVVQLKGACQNLGKGRFMPASPVSRAGQALL